MDQTVNAELSSIEYAIQDLAKRVAALGDGLARVKDERGAAELYQAERALINAVRRVQKISRA